jgi:gluconokinase
MSSGIPLTDDDRLPWLALIRSTAERVCKEEWEKHDGKMKSVADGGIGRAGVVIACSALKKWYRDILRGDVSAIPPPVDDLVSTHPCLS